MKKFILFLLLVFLIQLPSCAEYLPAYTNSVSHYGIGVINAKGAFNIYQNSDEKSEILAGMKIEDGNFSCKKRNLTKCSEENTFVAFSSGANIAFLSVEADLDDWYYVCFDQNKKLFGWIKKTENIDFFNWSQIINLYGRKYGVYLFRNLPDKYKKLYSKPDENSGVVDDFYIAKHVTIWLVDDNWVLVKVFTYDGSTKTGWIQWRLDNSSLTLFPAFHAN